MLIFKTLIAPKREYTTSIWNHGINNTSAVESIQNPSAGFIPSNYHRTANTPLMKACLPLTILFLCQKLSRQCFFHKIYHCNPTFRQALFSESFYISHTDHQLKVEIPHCSTSTLNASLLPQTPIDWKRLFAAIATITVSNNFKIAITNLLNDAS